MNSGYSSVYRGIGRPCRHAKLNSIARFQADATINPRKILGADTHEGDALRWDHSTNSVVLLTSSVLMRNFSLGGAHDGRSRIGSLCQSRMAFATAPPNPLRSTPHHPTQLSLHTQHSYQYQIGNASNATACSQGESQNAPTSTYPSLYSLSPVVIILVPDEWCSAPMLAQSIRRS